MARTIAAIKSEIGNAYIAQQEVQARYNLTTADVESGFDALFSKVSVENILFYAVSVAVCTFERIMDVFRAEIQSRVDAAYIANAAWWRAQALKFQLGDALRIDPVTFVYGYATITPEKQIVKRCAVREAVTETGVTYVNLLVNPINETNVLTSDEKNRFTDYCGLIKPAGVMVNVISEAAQLIGFDISIKYNSMVLNPDGSRIQGEGFPVRETIQMFIDRLTDTNFGGELNTTKLTDALQQTEGVTDAYINKVYTDGTEEASRWGDFISPSGWFSYDTTTMNISYLARL